MTTVSERLIYLMESVDMKQTELAAMVGISKQSLYKYLHCKCEPRAEIIAKMAKVLGTSADYIVGLTNDPSPRAQSEASEKRLAHETELMSKYQKLNSDNKIRAEERIDSLLDSQE